jgi:hypothetical protein
MNKNPRRYAPIGAAAAASRIDPLAADRWIQALAFIILQRQIRGLARNPRHACISLV